MTSLCPICLETDNDNKCSLPCKHIFHIHCMAKYIICNHWNGEDNAYKNNDLGTFITLKCPYCRQVPQFNSLEEAKIQTELCTRTQQVSLRDYFNQRMLNNINLYVQQRGEKNKHKFIVETFNANSIGLRHIQDMYMFNGQILV